MVTGKFVNSIFVAVSRACNLHWTKHWWRV